MTQSGCCAPVKSGEVHKPELPFSACSFLLNKPLPICKQSQSNSLPHLKNQQGDDREC